jgi:hypothetical protein
LLLLLLLLLLNLELQELAPSILLVDSATYTLRPMLIAALFIIYTRF